MNHGPEGSGPFDAQAPHTRAPHARAPNTRAPNNGGSYTGPPEGSRWLLVGVVAMALLVVVALALALVRQAGPGAGDGSAKRTPSASGSTLPTASASSPTAERPTTEPRTPGPSPIRPAQVPAGRVSVELLGAGISPRGEITGGWSWTDSTGRHLLASLRESEGSPEEDGGRIRLRVLLLSSSGLSPTAVRRILEPELWCRRQALTARVDPGSVTVKDLDGDGTAEVTAGWVARCGSPQTPSRVRLVLVSRGRLYTLRGAGVITGAAEDPEEAGQAGVDRTGDDEPSDGAGGGELPQGGGTGGRGADPEPEPEPGWDAWPVPLRESALDLFHGQFY
ncbi:MAG: hypothetical protein QG608_905 [Actinomycetota bacterium]|nr:hypothetical protein [Actinomycetota bacterium]